MRAWAAQHEPVTRLATALGALCDFLSEPSCRQCEVLQGCLRHLQEDASERPSVYSISLRRSLRGVVPFAYVHHRFPCRRCLPAEILAVYLTPGEEMLPQGEGGELALSWLSGEEDIHW
ncbi:MAG: hypothetical protein HY268_23585 [Deltaproteobacteria bacterium]|nr:hypothetical protein [Deltaproteobacteria bacterium]